MNSLVRPRLSGSLVYIFLLVTFFFIPTDETPPQITVWHGDQQSFGSQGQAQRWINILGNVVDPDGEVQSLRYSLNGGSWVPLSIGSDKRRLWAEGDFNADIPVANLRVGQNEVRLQAANASGVTSEEVVTVAYSQPVVELPVCPAWSAPSTSQTAVQIVDGHWSWDGAGIRTVEWGYDRVIAIGDMSWQSYEVLFAVTIHAVDTGAFNDQTYPNSTGPGLGTYLYWTGHSADLPRRMCDQPNCGWMPFGSSNWYEWRETGADRISVSTPNTQSTYYTGLQFETGETYWFRARVQNDPAGNRFALKVWQDSEPADWTSILTETTGKYTPLNSGSLLLIAHHVDVTFHDISVTALDDPQPCHQLVFIPAVVR